MYICLSIYICVASLAQDLFLELRTSTSHDDAARPRGSTCPRRGLMTAPPPDALVASWLGTECVQTCQIGGARIGEAPLEE